MFALGEMYSLTRESRIWKEYSRAHITLAGNVVFDDECYGKAMRKNQLLKINYFFEKNFGVDNKRKNSFSRQFLIMFLYPLKIPGADKMQDCDREWDTGDIGVRIL